MLGMLEEKYYNKNITTYNEGIYKKPVSNIMKYDKEETDNIEVKENEKIENNHDTGKHTYRDTRIEQRYFTSYLHYDSPFNEIP